VIVLDEPDLWTIYNTHEEIMQRVNIDVSTSAASHTCYTITSMITTLPYQVCARGAVNTCMSTVYASSSFELVDGVTMHAAAGSITHI
jgi:hypothetical protein